jgi:hypothetical protein
MELGGFEPPTSWVRSRRSLESRMTGGFAPLAIRRRPSPICADHEYPVPSGGVPTFVLWPGQTSRAPLWSSKSGSPTKHPASSIWPNPGGLRATAALPATANAPGSWSAGISGSALSATTRPRSPQGPSCTAPALRFASGSGPPIWLRPTPPGSPPSSCSASSGWRATKRRG